MGTTSSLPLPYFLPYGAWAFYFGGAFRNELEYFRWLSQQYKVQDSLSCTLPSSYKDLDGNVPY